MTPTISKIIWLVFMAAWVVSIVVYRYRDLDSLEIDPPAVPAKLTPFDRDHAR